MSGWNADIRDIKRNVARAQRLIGRYSREELKEALRAYVRAKEDEAAARQRAAERWRDYVCALTRKPAVHRSPNPTVIKGDPK